MKNERAISMAGAPALECSHLAAEFRLNPDYFPFICVSCHLRACDECGAKSAVCHGCGGAICEGCTATGRMRRMLDTSCVRYEHLCAPCVTRQDAARAQLSATVQVALSAGSWLEDLITVLEDATDEAREWL